MNIWDDLIRSNRFLVFAGPCAVENLEQIMLAAKVAKALGAVGLRGGAFKPRTRPESFQGLGEEALKYLALAKAETGLLVVTEVLDEDSLNKALPVADILQVGSRNMQNFALLKLLAKVDKPVLLKRGLAATIEEWLGAVAYLEAGGNRQIILCERGIRTFETMTRNTLDISAIPLLKKLTPYPVIADPSHAVGRRDIIPSLAKAAVAAGADGLLIEIHPRPETALSDGKQSLNFEEFEQLMLELKPWVQVTGKKL
ncbi:3-deoxy-7-phosphoheptulonate synthase [Carboxydothermus pertinax]|uniref:3-deoxy-7-phosphoheptulonate synthase n=1 Tax=Carboxydothermus pertinax TaxID=870242 RepID=A0A1L8CUR8_9THEO|nr:3-deoxy-7-phosphoheptulonate synthase [Carboxydothermus pertinax]GAV22660.1 3-deoxy-7-phosphoheptulonate synthase [Carboxydothermus pertinax]